MTTHDSADTGHEYDGIREHDNRLPRWWLFTLYGAVVFSFGYWLWFHTLGIGKNPGAQYRIDIAAMEAADQSRAAQMAGTLTEDALAARARDPAVVARGREVFMTNCLACHGDKGQGLVGPNLTDDFWLHGHRATDTLRVVSDGEPTKGMPPWKPVLGMERVIDVASYVLSLKGTHVDGKAPQGVDAEGRAAP